VSTPGGTTARPGLGSRAAAGGTITLAGQLAKLVVQTASIVVLARLIAPQDFGLVVMVSAVVGIGDVLRDLGLSMGSIQARSLSEAQRDNLFWINTGIGLLLTVVFFLVSWPLAAVYDEPRLVAITQALSVTFLANGMASQYRAQFTRQFRFRALVGVDVSAQAVGFVVAVLLALGGAGYWALVGQQIGQVVFFAAAAVSLGRWLPALPQRQAGVRDILAFGWPLTGTQLVGYLSRNVDSLVVGLRFGPDVLGVYSKAFQLLMMPLNQINAPATTVALPVLARCQDDPAEFRRYLLGGQRIMMTLTSAVLAVGIATADPLVDLVLGPAWAGAAPLFQILGVGGLFQVAAYATYWAFLGLGLTGSNLRFALTSRPVMIGLIVLGSSFGVTGVAVSYSVGVGLMWLWGLWWLRSVPSVPARDMLVNGTRSVVVSALAAVAGCAAVELAAVWSDVGRFALGSTVALAALAAIALCVRPFRTDVCAALGAARSGVRRAGGATAVSTRAS
jgi:PST family polysaccharide transporter